MGKTKIEWATDSWNPVTGCTKISEGCRNCYAERMTERFYGKGSFEKVVCHPDRLNIPLHWKKPRRIFVNSMSDLFHEDIPIEFIADIFNVMASSTADCGKHHKHHEDCYGGEKHVFQILTKRPQRMKEIIEQIPDYVGEHWSGDTTLGIVMEVEGWPLKNVWLGVSVEDQATADERIPVLLQTQAAVRWISAEPLLESIDLCEYLSYKKGNPPVGTWLSWLVCGGESGPNARPMNIGWIRSILAQCQVAKIPCFVKQLGSNPRHYVPGSGTVSLKLKSYKGGDISEFPEDLRVRQYP